MDFHLITIIGGALAGGFVAKIYKKNIWYGLIIGAMFGLLVSYGTFTMSAIGPQQV